MTTVETKASLTTDASNSFFDNVIGAITPAILRTFVQNVVASYLDTHSTPASATALANTVLSGPASGPPAVPTFRTPTATDISFTQAGAGAVTRTMTAKIEDYAVTPEDYGAVGDGIADDRIAVQAAIVQAQNSGATLSLKGVYGVSQAVPNTYCLLISSALTIRGTGAQPGFPLGWIKPLATVGPTIDIILIQGTSVAGLRDLYIDSIAIGTNAAALGNHAIHIVTASGVNDFGNAIITNCKFWNVNGMSIQHDHTGGGTGGWFQSQITNNDFFNGITLNSSGSGLTFSGNDFHGNTAGQTWLYSNIVGGGFGPVIQDNLFETQGYILIDAGENTQIINNKIELDSGNGVSNAFVLIRGSGAASSMNGTKLQFNAILNETASTSINYHVRVFPPAQNTFILENSWYAGNATTQITSTGNWINNAATPLYLSSNQYFEPHAGTPIDTNPIVNSGAIVATQDFSRRTVADTTTTATITDWTIAYTNLTASRKVNLLPAKNFAPGRILIIRDDSGLASLTNTIVAVNATGDTIQGAASSVTVVNFAQGKAELQSDGISSWLLPQFTVRGDITSPGAAFGVSVPTTVAVIGGVGVTGATGTGNVVFSAQPTFNKDRFALITNATTTAGTTTATLTNWPVAGNPAFFLKINVNTTNMIIPCWNG